MTPPFPDPLPMTQDTAPASPLTIDDLPVAGHGVVRRIAVTRPERLNALDSRTIDALQAAFDAAAADPAVRVVVGWLGHVPSRRPFLAIALSNANGRRASPAARNKNAVPPFYFGYRHERCMAPRDRPELSQGGTQCNVSPMCLKFPSRCAASRCHGLRLSP